MNAPPKLPREVLHCSKRAYFMALQLEKEAQYMDIVPAFELADWRIMHARETGDREKERLFTEVHRVMMAMECFGADALYVLSDEDPFHDQKE